MTTYRRFCCNDLLLIEALNLYRKYETYSMFRYMELLAKWPESFLVAKRSGGRIGGYITGEVEGEGVYSVGHVSTIVVPLHNADLAIKLLKRLEDSCENFYSACTMTMLVALGDSEHESDLNMLGYRAFKAHEEASLLEMRKPLSRLIKHLG